MPERRIHSPSQRVSAAIRRRQLARPVEHLSGGPESSPAPRMLCGLFERVRHRLVRRTDRGGQLPGARFGIVEQLCKPSVNLGPPSPVGRLVRPGREERMREADAALVEVDDARRERGAKACLTIDPRRRFRDRDRGMCVRCCREQEVTALWRQRLQSSVDEVVQRFGDRQRVSAIDGDAASAKTANDLEGVERVAPRRVPHLVEDRLGEHQTEM